MELLLVVLLIVFSLFFLLRHCARNSKGGSRIEQTFSVSVPVEPRDYSLQHTPEVSDRFKPRKVGATLRFKYQDAKEWETERIVDVEAIDDVKGSPAIIGHCRLRNAARTFLIKRIRDCVDLETGEIVQDVYPYLLDKAQVEPNHSAKQSTGRPASSFSKKRGTQKSIAAGQNEVAKVDSTEFVAIDVETANARLSSICQVGIASFRDGVIADSWVTLVDPEDHFDQINISIHGITPAAVKGSPKWKEALKEINVRLREKIVVSHTAFDRLALTQACDLAATSLCACTWLDSTRVVRRAWPQFAHGGYGLPNVAAHFGITYRAHDALEDARCAGEILLRAVADTGLSVDQWVNKAKQPIDPSSGDFHPDVNPGGDLAGEVVVFTGAFRIPRGDAVDAATSVGCRVDERVTQRTTLLVLGDQYITKPAGQQKSSKHRKVEELISKGHPIRILTETDFQHLVSSHTQAAITPLAN